MNIREYQPGDEVKICQLFKDSYGKEMTLEFWNWRFRDNPYGHGIIYLAWDGDKLASHYAVSPVEHNKALSGTTMTHPDYRRQGLFTELANRTYEKASALGIGLVYAFSKRHQSRMGLIGLGFKDVYEIPTFRLDNPAQAERKTKSFTTDEYTHWRYNDDYIHTESGIYKIYKDELQVMCGEPDLELAGNRPISMWLSTHNPLHLELEKIGFYNSTPIVYFVCKTLDKEFDSFLDYRNWNITMGDSDVF